MNKTFYGTKVKAKDYISEGNITLLPGAIFQVVSGGSKDITIASNEIEITISLETYNKLEEIN